MNFSKSFDGDINKADFYKDLFPNIMDLRKDFDINEKKNQKWGKAVDDWFSEGKKKSDFTIKKGINENKAFTHLATIISS